MTRQTLINSLSTICIAALSLSACGTVDFKDAEPEKYMGFDCEQLAQLAESYREPMLVDDVSERERMNERDDRVGVRDDARPYEIELERDRRSIALARRQKGCS